MTVRPQAQIAIGEQILNDPALEAALEARQRAKDAVAKKRKAFKEVDDDAKARIRQLEIGSGSVRVGRFVLSERDVAGRAVTFETEPTTRIAIRLVPDEPF